MDNIYLMGSEAVENAASTMSHAAHNMQIAADNFDSALHRHQMFMDDWLHRFSVMLEESK